MPTIQVTGQLVDPTTGAEVSAEIRITSIINYGKTTKKSSVAVFTDALGSYDFPLVEGVHMFHVKYSGEYVFTNIGTAIVGDSTPNPIDLIQLISLSDENPPSELVTELQQLREDTINDIVDTSAQVLENAGYQGEWVSGTSTALKGETWQVSGRYYVALKNTSVDPINDNNNWREDVTTDYVTTAQNDIVGGSIFKGSNGEYVQNGDVVPSGTTHLRVLVDGETKCTFLYKKDRTKVAASGIVANLNTSTVPYDVDIGGESYYIIPVNSDSGGDICANSLGLSPANMASVNTSILNDAIIVANTLGVDVEVKSGKYQFASGIEFKALASVYGEGKSTEFIFTLSEGNSQTLIKMGVAHHLKDVSVVINCDAFNGIAFDWLSSYQETVRLESLSDLTYFKARKSDLRNVDVYYSGDNHASTNTSHLCRFKHDGFGINQWGCSVKDIVIQGPFKWLFNVVLAQEQQVGTPQAKSPWINSLTVENVVGEGCYNVVRTNASNPAANTELLPISPSKHLFKNVQIQALPHSERFADIQASRGIIFENCTPWDWEQQTGNKPYLLGYPSSDVSGGRDIYGVTGVVIKDISQALTIDDVVEFDNDAPLTARSVMQRSDTGFGGFVGSPPDAGSGTAGVYTYRDLWNLPPGLYTVNRDPAEAMKLKGLAAQSPYLRFWVLNVVITDRGGRLFQAYPSTLRSDGVQARIHQSPMYAYCDATVYTGQPWIDDDIDYEFWKSSDGGSTANDAYVGGQGNQPSNPYNGMQYYCTSVISGITTAPAPQWYDASAGSWRLADGTIAYTP